MSREVKGALVASGIRVGIVVARFNEFITDRLLSGATDAYIRHGGKDSDLTIVRVPGSFEIPLVAKKLAQSGNVDAVVTLGAVIRGATTHYDYVCSEAARGVLEAGMSSGVPVTFGIITTENIEQAIERAGSKSGNKGSDAMLAAVEMVHVLRDLAGSSR